MRDEPGLRNTTKTEDEEIMISEGKFNSDIKFGKVDRLEGNNNDSRAVQNESQMFQL